MTSSGPGHDSRSGSSATASSIHFQTVDVPGAAGGTWVNGVNDHGVLAGTYFDQNHGSFGYIKDGGQLVRFDYPGTSGVTTVASLNNPGMVIGSYTDSNGASHGWIRSASGSSSPINHPLAGSGSQQGTLPFGINDSGTVVGGYIDASGAFHGFIDKRGTFTTVDAPQAGTGPGQGTYLSAENDPGVITGAYIDASGIYHGFTDTNGVFSSFEAPGSIGPGEGGTTSSGISNTRTLVGYYGNAAGTIYQGWLEAGGQFTVFSDPQAPPGGTLPLGISENGKTVCGFYTDANGISHGFIATISPEAPANPNDNMSQGPDRQKEAD
jgi:hypothetical protein